jgi:hypothetical protein
MADYTYETVGFDNFLCRSVGDIPQQNLDSQGPVSTQIRYDAAQVSGALGDTLTVGNIKINKTNIIVNDGQNDRLLIGEQQDGF